MSLYKMRISAKAICFNNKGEVLLVKGKTLYEGKEFWCVPGGGVEEGESLFTAAEREVLEETGYSVK
jgi:8-oxo-dGTP pyrophosphatase MutT (NUDIX family)